MNQEGKIQNLEAETGRSSTLPPPEPETHRVLPGRTAKPGREEARAGPLGSRSVLPGFRQHLGSPAVGDSGHPGSLSAGSRGGSLPVECGAAGLDAGSASWECLLSTTRLRTPTCTDARSRQQMEEAFE